MEVVPVKKRLRRLHKLLVNSKYALNITSNAMSNTWVGDLLFLLSCRRNIMLNELDRELGRLEVPNRPDPEVTRHYEGLVANASGDERYLRACEEEEIYLASQLENLGRQPGLPLRTRTVINNLLQETRANLKDILFLRENHSALRA